MFKEKTISRRLGACLLLLALLIGTFVACFPLSASAAEEAVYIDKTSINEDFAAFGIDRSLYPAKDGAERQILYFIESCYSEKFSGQDRHYGLYLWVYNPTCTPITNGSNNDVNLSADGGASYENVGLEMLACSADHLYYKFRVEDAKIASLLSAAREYAKGHDGTRSYKIAGIQLQTGNGLAHDTEVAKDFIFTGYAKGCDETTQEASTLEMKTAGLEIIHLDLQHTTYRSSIGGYNTWNCDAIHTAYFALPKVYLEQYGNLQKIKAEWDEYKTKEIFVTSSGGRFDELTPYIAKSLPNGLDESLTCRVLWDIYKSTDAAYLCKGYNDLSKGDTVDFSFRDGSYYFYGNGLLTVPDYNNISRFDWLLPIEEDDMENQKPISSAKIESYMREYTSKYGGGLAGGQFSKSLFLDGIDADRTTAFDPDGDHHVVQEIDVDTDIGDFHVPGNFWDWIFGDGFTVLEGLSPIEVISSLSEVEGLSVEDFEERYYVENDGGSSGDVLGDVKKILDDEKMCVVLFRFAVTDYYSSAAIFDNTDAWYDEDYDGTKNMADINGYVAQETVFLNFDVISLSFKTADGGNKLTVIPVVADPINVIPSLIPPVVNEELEWLKILVMLVMVLVLLILIGIYCPPLLTFIWKCVSFIIRVIFWLLSLPFKLLRLLFRRR